LEKITRTVEREAWHEHKLRLMGQMSKPGFWDSDQRFVVLGEVEYLDRIESGLEVSRSLLSRIEASRKGKRQRYPRDVISRLAQQLYLLEAATLDVREQRPRDAFIEIDARHGVGGVATRRDSFAERVGEMYRNWARRRGMQCLVLNESGGDDREPYRLLLAVSGFGAYSILRLEEGLHIHEVPKGERGRAFRKSTIRVRVAPQPEIPPSNMHERRPEIALRAQASEVLERKDPDTPKIVRRYRDQPSPLIRDDVRGWRTGLSDLVMGGDFDVMTDALETVEETHS
jgi:ATP-dependent Clp protease ATP-binding subunit ClpC